MHPHDPPITGDTSIRPLTTSWHKKKTTYFHGWQLASVTAPDVLALTCANSNGLLIRSARRTRFELLHAGVTDVKIQGVPEPSSGSLSYHPTPKPSPSIYRQPYHYAYQGNKIGSVLHTIEWSTMIEAQSRVKGLVDYGMGRVGKKLISKELLMRAVSTNAITI